MGKEQDYQEISYHDRCSEQEIQHIFTPPRDGFFLRNKSFFFIILISIPSIILNIILASRHLKIIIKEENVNSEFSKLSYSTPVQYQSFTDYWGSNDTLADELWDSLDTDPIEIALSDEYAKSHGLEVATTRFPWDSDKGLYVVKAYHQLHCLKQLHKTFNEMDRGLKEIDRFHIQHCLDSLRQDVMCLADDTPMAIPENIHKVGDGQIRKCRDWNKFTAWAVAPERTACFKQLSDFKPVIHTLEKHAFCPEGSEYYPVMKEYFEKHGHKDPFVL